MKYKHNYQIGPEDVDIKGNATNRALMTMMEDIGGLHSDSVGYGLDSVERTGQAWVVLDWKIEIIKRPHYRDEITAYTWSRNHNIACAYRDFELFDTQGEKLARATSRWVLIDIVKRRPLRLTQELIEKYQGEPQSQAFEEELENMSYPKDFFDTENAVKQRYTVLRRDIDSNMHMHNLAYLDAAGELLPQQIYEEGEKNHIRISYKKEILYGEEITGVYIQHEDRHVVGFTDTNKGVRAIVELW